MKFKQAITICLLMCLLFAMTACSTAAPATQATPAAEVTPRLKPHRRLQPRHLPLMTIGAILRTRAKWSSGIRFMNP